MRAILRCFCVEDQEVTRDDVLLEAAQETRLEVDAFLRDYRDADARRAELEHQGHGFPHVPLGFYSMALTDGGDRTVLLDYALDPAVVEEAIDYLSGGRLRVRRPTDLVSYLRRHGPASLREIARVVALTDAQVDSRLGTLAKEGRVARTDLAGAPHWSAVTH